MYQADMILAHVHKLVREIARCMREIRARLYTRMQPHAEAGARPRAKAQLDGADRRR